MSQRWHISEDGVARRCKAENGKCPLSSSGDESQVIHGSSRREVIEKYEDSMSHLEIQDPVHPHDKNSKYAVLSDVDGTLTKGSFVLDHAVYLHERGDVNLRDLPEKWKRDPKNEKLIAELATSYKESISGMSEEDISVDEFIDDYMKNEKGFYKTLNQLKEFKKRGWEIQLISGSPDYLVRRLAERNGFYGKGSTYHKDDKGRFTGEVDGMFGAEAKEDYIRSLKPNRFKRILGMGDTSSDEPIFDVSDHSTLVAPTEETARKIKASLIVQD